ncbi:hypothetical protein ACFV4P_35630 [Kitasatospora sp. NPDC059795]|uniref:hypothetical protein n=1 Tax=unclassified Kitasatospora TaxID=2633591 RepID=UPI000938F97D|nr:hypothetical protein [Kitasatospora sp. CB01950]OKI96761.1 hypothetical protein AMK19_32505 [Kitasatospora sp. CB01950]
MSHHTHGTHDAPADEWPPTETPEARMTAEGSPPPDESEKTAADGPEFAVPVSSPPEPEDGE